MLSDFLRKHGEYYDDKSFQDITTIKMGGKIAHLIYPYFFEDLQEMICYLKINHVPYKVVGNGSNLICGSSTYDGVVISLKNLNNFEIHNDTVYAQAGVLVPFLANVLAKNDLSGLEFASGIPGNIGGLIYMNAGAYKSSMSDVVEKVYVLKNDEMVWLDSSCLNFSYRQSIFQSHPHWVILAAQLKLVHKDSAEIFALMKDRLTRRQQTQPLDAKSAGSCFRNPENEFAWHYIDGIGYRGYCKNGVCVSNKHSNFIINEGGGTAEDYLSIAYEIIDKVKEKYNLKLIMEVEKFNC